MHGPVLGLVAAVGVAFASMVLYAILGGPRDRDVSAKGSRLVLGLGDFVVHWFMWLLGPIERVLIRTRVRPETLNYLGLLLGAVSGVAIGAGQLALGGVAVIAGGVCDILDGRVARSRGLTSDFGRFIDSTLDRFVEVFAFLGFAWYLREQAGGPLLAAAAMAGSLLVSYARARGESVGVVCTGGLMLRAERLVLMCTVCFGEAPLQQVLGWPPGRLARAIMGVMALGTMGTAAYRTAWTGWRLRRAEREGSADLGDGPPRPAR